MNDELRTRGLDADLLTSYLESVFSSLRSGVVVLDRDYRIQVWNRRCEDLWGIRADEVTSTEGENAGVILLMDEHETPRGA